MQHWVDSIYKTMSLDEKIGQLFMLVADPNTKDVNTKKILDHVKLRKIGGLLFSKGSWTDQAKSTNLYQQAARIPLLISLDGEWGLSMRLGNTTKFPRNMMAGAILDEKTLELYGAEVARQCRQMGIHINFAPVLDVNSNPKNPVIGTRSFGENPTRVIASGNAYSRGLEGGGVMAVGKHFPGHGDTDVDSHHATPVLQHSREALEEKDLLPFRSYVNAGFSGMMTGHLVVPGLDSISDKPASLSKVIITEWLRDSLGFSGLSFTDALVMKGAASAGNVCVQALLAGNDILLSPGRPVEDFQAVKKAVADSVVPMQLIEEKCRKILQYKYILGLNDYRPIKVEQLHAGLNTDSAEWICRKMNAEAMSLLKNDDGILPLRHFERVRIASLSIGDKGISSFQHVLKKYTKVDAYFLGSNSKPSDISTVVKALDRYQVVVCAIHSHREKVHPDLLRLLKEKKTVFCYFASPYSLSSFKSLVAGADAVVMAYENTDDAQDAAAQAVMGGLGFSGRLTVSIPGLFQEGTGIATEKTRLSYRSPLEVGISPRSLQAVDNILQDAIRQKAFPGCQMLIAKDGVVIYEKAFGYFDYANTHPVKTTDLYDLASVTKAMATVPAVMKLYDNKQLALSDRLGDSIPAIRNSDKAGITVKEALLHESGLLPFIPFYQLTIDKNSFKGQLFSSKRDATYRVLYGQNTYGRTDFKFLPDLVSTTQKQGFNTQVAKDFYVSDAFKLMMLREIASSNLRQQKSYRYSDLNFMLLKEVVEAIADKPFDEFLDAHFYERLGANHTMFQPLSHKIEMRNIAPTENDQMIRNQILSGYVHDEAAAFMGGVSGNAGLFSNANDLAKLLQLFLNEGQYGGEEYYSKATSDVFLKTKSKTSRRGLGFDKPDPQKKPDFLPESVFGHTGFTGTCVWADPDNQLLYILLTNRVYPTRTNSKLSTLEIREKVREAIYQSIKKTDSEAKDKR